MKRAQIAEALQTLGLRPGHIIFVHSSLRSIGYVEDGADAVVNAFLDLLGPTGTLVVPAFTFSHGGKSNPVFDPIQDPSEMGRISEVVRTRPGAQRSHHLLHSVAALGLHAEDITASHGPSAWAADGPFWKLYELDAHILMLGVPYLRCTFFHVIEQLVQVRYRQWREVESKVRDPDGRERPLPMFGYSPKPGFAGNDFNKLGSMLEERGLAQVSALGNAVARRFRARDALEVGLAEYRKDPFLLVKTGNSITQLRDGVLTEELHNEKSVINPTQIYERKQ